MLRGTDQRARRSTIMNNPCGPVRDVSHRFVYDNCMYYQRRPFKNGRVQAVAVRSWVTVTDGREICLFWHSCLGNAFSASSTASLPLLTKYANCGYLPHAVTARSPHNHDALDHDIRDTSELQLALGTSDVSINATSLLCEAACPVSAIMHAIPLSMQGDQSTAPTCLDAQCRESAKGRDP